MIATTTQLQSLSDLCKWPDEFPRFVARQVDSGVDLVSLLEKPWKWDREFAQFQCGCNVAPPKRDADLSDWLNDEVGAKVKRSSGGSTERPIEYRDIEFFGGDGEIFSQVVADFSECDYLPERGEKFTFQAVLCSSLGGVPGKVLCEATAFPEVRHGLQIVVFEVEAGAAVCD